MSKKKNPLFVCKWDKKNCLSRSPFVITQQASRGQTAVILRTDFSIPPSLMIDSYTVNLGIFARVIFSRNFPDAKFLENKTLSK